MAENAEPAAVDPASLFGWVLCLVVGFGGGVPAGPLSLVVRLHYRASAAVLWSELNRGIHS